jgi:hypothetical protein
VSVPATCPRCAGPLRPPGLMSSDWVCERHGAVSPLRVLPRVGDDVLAQVARDARVPLWCPVPLLPAWVLTGVAIAGDERSGTRASAVALAGPAPLGGTADLVLVAEEPGIGLGARVAGLDHVDPGEALAGGAPQEKVVAAGHPAALWQAGSAPDRRAFVGEALGVWLWVVVWPPEADLVLLEDLELHDLREEDSAVLGLPVGAPSTRLTAPPR